MEQILIKTQEERLNLLKEVLAYLGTDIDHFTDEGISPNEINEVCHNLFKGKYIADKSFKHVGLYDDAKKIVVERFGSGRAYMHTPQAIKRKHERSKKTNLERYGVDNISKLESRRESLRGNKGYFTGNHTNKIDYQKKLKLNDYIKGKRCLPRDAAIFYNYEKLVWELTMQNAHLLGEPSYCYYTGLKLQKSNSSNYNEPTVATIDHKHSILRSFLDGVKPEDVANVNNLCWCAKHFNSLKGTKTESEIKLLGMDMRYKEIYVLQGGEFNYENY